PFSLQCPLAPPALHSFPTRRSSDLDRANTSRSRTSPPVARATTVSPGATCGVGTRCCTTALRRYRRSLACGAASPNTSTCSHTRSEEHTSELQSPYDLVCRLLLEKK